MFVWMFVFLTNIHTTCVNVHTLYKIHTLTLWKHTIVVFLICLSLAHHFGPNHNNLSLSLSLSLSNPLSPLPSLSIDFLYSDIVLIYHADDFNLIPIELCNNLMMMITVGAADVCLSGYHHNEKPSSRVEYKYGICFGHDRMLNLCQHNSFIQQTINM